MLEDDEEESTEAVAEAIFDMMDTDGSGNLTMHEIKSAFATLNTGLTDDDVAEIISRMDADDSGEVDREEFVKLITQILEGNL
jgi:calmodulin